MTTDPQRPEVDDPRVLALAKARQQIAYENPFNFVCPPWDGLTSDEQHLSLLDARNYLRAALKAGLVSAVPVAAPPTTEQEALREVVAEALMGWAERNNDSKLAVYRRPEIVRQNAYSRADAVLAALPAPADRAATLREAADGLIQLRDSLITEPDVTGKYLAGIERSASLLRRLAVEAGQAGGPSRGATEPQPEEAAPQREPHPTEADLHHALAVLARFQGRDTAPEAVHACPPDGSGLTPCCGRTPFELPRTDRISSEAAAVTCSPAVVAQPGKDPS